MLHALSQDHQSIDCFKYEQIIIGLCRLDKVTQYLRIPPELWSLGWSPMVMDLDNLTFASIPIDYLHDKDILEVYVKRLLTLGKDAYTKYWGTYLV